MASRCQATAALLVENPKPRLRVSVSLVRGELIAACELALVRCTERLGVSGFRRRNSGQEQGRDEKETQPAHAFNAHLSLLAASQA